jgi:hypothetical protein
MRVTAKERTRRQKPYPVLAEDDFFERLATFKKSETNTIN